MFREPQSAFEKLSLKPPSLISNHKSHCYDGWCGLGTFMSGLQSRQDERDEESTVHSRALNRNDIQLDGCSGPEMHRQLPFLCTQ